MSKQRPTPDKLSNELAGASAFFRPVPQPAKAEPKPAPANPTTLNPVETYDVVTSRRHDVMTSSPPAPTPQPAGFDLNRPTASRDSLRLSIDETKALDALRATLKWDYDLTVSKNDICRAALHWLLEEFSARGEKSQAVVRLKRKQTSR